MTKLKSLGDVFSHQKDDDELYLSDKKKRFYRKKKGYYTREDSTFDFIFLLKAWEEIVGKMLAENSLPLKIKGKVLYVSTKHPIFSQEMGFLSVEIMGKIVEKFPVFETLINKIKYINNEYTRGFPNQAAASFHKKKQERPKLHPFSPEYKKLNFQAQELFKDIEDDEIRDILKAYYLS